MTKAKKQLGDRGEALVAAWLQQRGWQIVAQQWHCRQGELDIVAVRTEPEARLAFVEVKTRQPRSLDAGGRLAITPQKQQKLWHAAQQFLAQHPHYGDYACQFDVALVARQATSSQAASSQAMPALRLVEYIAHAFELT